MTGPVTPAERANELPPDDPLAAVRDVARLAALWRLALLDTPAEEAFDRLTRLTARLLDVPVALVSLVDADRQFFKSGLGLPEPWASRRETPLSYSFCQHAVARRRPLAIADARVDPLVQDSPAIAELGVIAYLGVPLITPAGHALGTLCAVDSQPRAWTAEDLAALSDLAALALAEIERRAAERETELLLRLVETHLPILLISCDRAGVVARAEGAGLAALGRQPAALVGRTVAELGRDARMLAEDLRRALAGEATDAVGGVGGRLCRMACAPLRDERGEITGAVGIALDLTAPERLAGGGDVGRGA